MFPVRLTGNCAINFETILILLLLMLANGVFAMSEAAMISSRRARLQQRADDGDAGARAAIELAKNPNRFLSTIQIGITLIGIFSGAFGEAALAQSVAAYFSTIPFLAPSADVLGTVVVVLLITYLSLVVGELVPKRLALNNAEGIAAAVARPMRLLSRLAAPVVALLSISTDLLLRLLGARPSEEPPVTEEEVEFMIEEGTQAGIFEEAEQDIVSNLFRAGDLYVSAVMTIRSDIVWLDVLDSWPENLARISQSRHTHYPVYKGEERHLRGILAVRDIFPQIIKGETPDLRAALTQPLFIPERTSTLAALELLRASGKMVALVINEHSDIEGLVTLANLVEAILGEFPSFTGAAREADAVRRTDGSWLLDGLMQLEEVEDTMGRDIFPEEERGSYQTLGGFAMARIGRIPRTADHFEWQGLHFEVMDMDGRRVDKLLVRALDPESEDHQQTDDTP